MRQTKVVTKRAKSVALIGSMKGKIVIKGDILSTGIKWNANQRVIRKSKIVPFAR